MYIKTTHHPEMKHYSCKQNFLVSLTRGEYDCKHGVNLILNTYYFSR